MWVGALGGKKNGVIYYGAGGLTPVPWKDSKNFLLLTHLSSLELTSDSTLEEEPCSFCWIDLHVADSSKLLTSWQHRQDLLQRTISIQVHSPHILSFSLPMMGGGLEGRLKCLRTVSKSRFWNIYATALVMWEPVPIKNGQRGEGRPFVFSSVRPNRAGTHTASQPLILLGQYLIFQDVSKERVYAEINEAC